MRPDFEQDAEAFSSALNLEHYLHGAGLKPRLDLRGIFDQYRRLSDVETFLEIRGVEMPESLGEKYRRFLLDFVASSYLENGVSELSERIAEAEATVILTWEDRQVAYRSVPVTLANLGEGGRRHTLDQIWRSAVAQLNGLRQERVERMDALVDDLGELDYVDLWDDLRGLGLENLSVQMLLLLTTTEDLYRDHFLRLITPFELDFESIWKADLGWVFRGAQYDLSFSAERLLPVLHATLRNLGFALEDQHNIRLDLESRPMKSSRAFCAPISIPRDVRLVLKPIGGRLDYETLLHEAGHAEHFANVDPTLPFGYRRLGDNAVTEGYAFLLQYLTTDERWLRRHVELESEAYIQLGLINKLYMLRRYATKILYEVELHRTTDDIESMQERYVDLFSRNLRVQYFPEEYLADLDDAFYAAQYVRAWMFEAQLRGYLKREFDEEWFRAPGSGKFLTDLWREGQKYTVDELVRFMGYDDLSIDPLLGEIRDVLGR